MNTCPTNNIMGYALFLSRGSEECRKTLLVCPWSV
jgi:hypothetical protein